MTKFYAYIRHNAGAITGFALIPFVLIYIYSCQSVVVSMVDANRKVTRTELIAEVDLILSRAEVKFEDLDRQDLVKQTIFNSVLDLAQGKTPNPIGVVLALAGILGTGATIDNIRKRTHINTLKGDTLNAKVKEAVEKIVHKPNL